MGTEKHGETWGQTERFPDFSDIFFCPMTRLSSFLPRGANQGHRNAPFFFRAAVSSHLRISTEIQGSQVFSPSINSWGEGNASLHSLCVRRLWATDHSSSGLIGSSQTAQISRPDFGLSTVAFDFMTHTLSKNQ